MWVFLIFVCKRNVYGVMTGQARGLYNTVRHTVRSLSRQVTGEVFDRHPSTPTILCQCLFLRLDKSDFETVFPKQAEERRKQY